MNIEQLSSGLGLWLATYLLHSTLLLATAWLLTRLPRLGAPRAAETIWRTALYGAVLTASLHAGFGAPLWQADVPLRRAALGPSAPPPEPVLAELPPLPPVAPIAPEVSVAAPLEATSPPAPLAPVEVVPFADALPHPAWLLVLWPLGIGVALRRRRRSRRHLRRSLRTRSQVRDPAVCHAAARLAAEAGVRRRVRLTASPSLSSPVAFGIHAPEICLPARATETLEPALLEAMLAHEVAHVARHDAAWLRAYRAITTLLFFQPLNFLAVRRLHDTAEMLCDAWAAREPERRVALARCLTAVAAWILEQPAPQGVSAMALRPSLLGRRVERLVADEAGAVPPGRGTVLVAALPLVAVLALAPGFDAGHTPDPTHQAAYGSHPASPSGESVPDKDAPAQGPWGVLDGELAALNAEMQELLLLLRDAGHPALATRLDDRRRSLSSERDRLRYQLDEQSRQIEERAGRTEERPPKIDEQPRSDAVEGEIR